MKERRYDKILSPVSPVDLLFIRELFVSNLHVDMCTGMARFSQQRQSWTRQPTNVKVSKVIHFHLSGPHDFI